MGNGTELGRVRALGSAHSGAHHWLLQRYTAIGNMFAGLYLLLSLILTTDFTHKAIHDWLHAPLPALIAGLFLLFGLLAKGDYSFQSVHDWLHSPLPALMAGLFVISTFWHARLGLQVLAEDYVKDNANKFAVITVLNLSTFAGAAFGLLSVARIALGA